MGGKKSELGQKNFERKNLEFFFLIFWGKERKKLDESINQSSRKQKKISEKLFQYKKN